MAITATATVLTGQKNANSHRVDTAWPKRLRGRRVAPRGVFAVATALALQAAAVDAQLRLEPRLRVSEQFSDNILLSPAGSETSDWVTQIAPGITLRHSGRNLNSRLDYELQTNTYARDASRNSISHALSGSLNSILVEDLVFFDTTARVGRGSVSPLGADVRDSPAETSNSVQTRSITFSPSMRRRFASGTSLDLGYSHTLDRTDSAQVSGGETRSAKAGINVPVTTSIYLGVSGRWERATTRSGEIASTSTTSGQADARYVVSERASVRAYAGREKSNLQTVSGASPTGTTYGLGASFAPSSRTTLDASIGHRYFGTVASVNFSHRAPNWSITLGGNRDLTTTRSGFGLAPTDDTAALLDLNLQSTVGDPAERARLVEQFIVQNGLGNSLTAPISFLTDRRYLESRITASVGLFGNRNTVFLNLHRSHREAASSGSEFLDAFATGDRLVEERGTLSWVHQLGPRTSLNGTIELGRNQSDGSATLGPLTSRRKSFSLAINRQLQQKANGSIQIRHVEQDASEGGASYKENAIFGTLTVRF